MGDAVTSREADEPTRMPTSWLPGSAVCAERLADGPRRALGYAHMLGCVLWPADRDWQPGYEATAARYGLDLTRAFFVFAVFGDIAWSNSLQNDEAGFARAAMDLGAMSQPIYLQWMAPDGVFE